MAANPSELAIDTSVVVKIFVREPETDLALDLYRSHQQGLVRLVALDLVALECANTLWMKVRKGDITAAEADLALVQLDEFLTRLAIVPARRVLRRSLSLSIQMVHPAYDTALLALAESRQTPFITADLKLYGKARTFSALPMMLRQWSPMLSPSP